MDYFRKATFSKGDQQHNEEGTQNEGPRRTGDSNHMKYGAQTEKADKKENGYGQR